MYQNGKPEPNMKKIKSENNGIKRTESKTGGLEGISNNVLCIDYNKRVLCALGADLE
jgi:hypothetical protein